MLPGRPLAVTRRGLLGTTLGVGALICSGCDGGPSGRAPRPTRVELTPDPDRLLVEDLRRSLADLVASLPGRARSRRVRRLSRALGAFHVHQLVALGALTGATASPAAPSGSGASGVGPGTAAQIAAREEEWTAAVTDALTRAVSGALARYLAALRAGQTQLGVSFGLLEAPEEEPDALGSVTSLEALQAALAAEHAAAYLLGVLGARTSAAGQPGLFAAVTADFLRHRARRDLLVQRIRLLGSDPAPAAPAYDVPPGLGTPTAIRRGALDLEGRVTATYLDLVALAPPGQRSWLAQVARESAVQMVGFGARPQTLPGLADR